MYSEKRSPNGGLFFMGEIRLIKYFRRTLTLMALRSHSPSFTKYKRGRQLVMFTTTLRIARADALVLITFGPSWWTSTRNARDRTAAVQIHNLRYLNIKTPSFLKEGGGFYIGRRLRIRTADPLGVNEML